MPVPHGTGTGASQKLPRGKAWFSPLFVFRKQFYVVLYLYIKIGYEINRSPKLLMRVYKINQINQHLWQYRVQRLCDLCPD
jgi:hypothetical protein